MPIQSILTKLDLFSKMCLPNYPLFVFLDHEPVPGSLEFIFIVGMDRIFVAQCIGLALSPILLLVLYIHWNDRRLTQIPPRALYFSSKRHTADDIHAEAERLAAAPPIDDTEKIPPKTGRRYIVVGGVSRCIKNKERPV